MTPRLIATLAAREAEAGRIVGGRRAVLERLADWIRSRLDAGGPARLVFVCTHNSRRSHLAALWAWAAAERVGLAGIETFSAGTEATALHPNAAAALERAGFVVEVADAGPDPVHRVRLRPDGPAVDAFSKTLEHPSLPHDGFAAVMTCSDADAGCPLVPGAAARFSLPYADPKTADGTPEAAATYDARSDEIAREMLHALHRAAETAPEED